MIPSPDAPLFTFRDNGQSSPERQSDGAVGHLRTLIITLALEPGSAINEVTLSQRMGYGRTPLREAFFRLADEHLLVILPHRSVAVAPLAISDLQQIYEARTDLECAAARLAAQRMTDGEIAAIDEREQQLETLAEKSDAESFYRWAICHFEFHCLIARACKNEYLRDSIYRVLPPSMRLDFFLFQHGAKGKDRARNHISIIKALQAHDSAAAEDAMRRHIAGSKERTLSFL